MMSWYTRVFLLLNSPFEDNCSLFKVIVICSDDFEGTVMYGNEKHFLFLKCTYDIIKKKLKFMFGNKKSMQEGT